ncbi:MAG: A/G-specific adenine glycosylase [Paludibacter sp.]|nr:A/G-specific adenine glycosylase [Paludibacter sp.]
MIKHLSLKKMVSLSSVLADWYGHYRRELPWRETRDPYRIWISEVILQQTRVNQGMEYYLRFVDRFPDVRSLAEASEQEVLAMWQGLGYYSRARNLHTAAKQVVSQHKGIFPRSYEAVRDLKGIGDYTAAAICSIAYDLPYAVVDGNVYRVLSRLFAIDTPVDSTQGKKEFQELAQTILEVKNPGLHNQAIMEFGALACVPANPDCENCPLQMNCRAYELDLVRQLPVKAKKTEVKELFYTYLYIHSGEEVVLQKRSSVNNIWKNMYEFPLIEASHLLTPEEVVSHPHLLEIGPFTLNPQPIDFTHLLSHRKINARFYRIEIDTVSSFMKNSLITTLQEIHHYPIPRLITRFLEY